MVQTFDKELNEEQLNFLKLYAYGYSIKEIILFYDNRSFTLKLKRQIEGMFKLNDWFKIIGISFKENILNKNDFLERKIINNASDYAHQILDEYNSREKKKFSKAKLTKHVISFVNTCDADLFLKNSFIQFDESEEFVIKYQFNKYFEFIETTSEPYFDDELIQGIFKKSKSNSWFGVFRKVFNTDIINKEPYSNINLKSQAQLCSREIYSFLESLSSKNDLENEFKIYNCLINLYNTYEYSYLLNSFYSSSNNVVRQNK
ncbi:hypothetical protein BFR04_16215 [Gaetbulibacter sp. 4G1]|nr:hypothetical protein [Gaetbulibacter sp. 4G1]PIA80752.1 hypothetical protein BFR04_16215 [Gaetbulibacter sp. 4G1]